MKKINIEIDIILLILGFCFSWYLLMLGTRESNYAFYSVQQVYALFEKGEEIFDNQNKYFKKDNGILTVSKLIEVREDSLLNKNLEKTDSFYYLYDEKTLFFIGPESYVRNNGNTVKLNNRMKDKALDYFKKYLISKDKDLDDNIIGVISNGDFTSIGGGYQKHFDDEVLSQLKDRIIIIIKE